MRKHETIYGSSEELQTVAQAMRVPESEARFILAVSRGEISGDTRVRRAPKKHSTAKTTTDLHTLLLSGSRIWRTMLSGKRYNLLQQQNFYITLKPARQIQAADVVSPTEQNAEDATEIFKVIGGTMEPGKRVLYLEPVSAEVNRDVIHPIVVKNVEMVKPTTRKRKK